MRSGDKTIGPANFRNSQMKNRMQGNVPDSQCTGGGKEKKEGGRLASGLGWARIYIGIFSTSQGTRGGC